MNKGNFKKVIFIGKGARDRALIMPQARKVYEHDTVTDHYEYYYYKDMNDDHHIFIVSNKIPTTEIIISKDITFDEMANDLQKLDLPSVVFKILIKVLLDIPELQLYAMEMILDGYV